MDFIVPPLPVAQVSLHGTSGISYITMNPNVTKFAHNRNGYIDVLKDNQTKPYEDVGLHGSTVYMSGKIQFSTPPVSNVEITVENWDYSSAYTVTYDPGAEEFAFDIPDWPAHYTVSTSFRAEDTIYNTAFRFHIGNADSI